MATMIELAGGDYIMSGFEPEETGVGTITNEDFYAMCMDADYLINLNMAAKLYTLEELIDYVPLVADFKAVKEGNVYVALSDSTIEETTYFSKMK